MKNKFIILLALFFSLNVLSSCNDNDGPELTGPVEQTIIMFYPWVSDLNSFFVGNVADMEEAFTKYGTDATRIFVYMAKSEYQALLFEIKRSGETYEHIIYEEYTYNNHEWTTENGITQIISDIKQYSPANRYSMIIGAHGLGWINKEATSRAIDDGKQLKAHWEYIPGVTRFFGSTSSNGKIEIPTLAASIRNNDITMEYILFDACYMGNIETAYMLKGVTNYLIASTSEILSYGIPYATVGRHLIGNPNYKEVCDEFYSFYSSYGGMPYGALSVINCNKTDELAEVMNKVNANWTFDTNDRGDIQRLDRYSPVIFFDMGSYVHYFCKDESLLAEFDQAMADVVEYTVTTPELYSGNRSYKVNEYSGITISDPSTHRLAADKDKTDWYIDTHK